MHVTSLINCQLRSLLSSTLQSLHSSVQSQDQDQQNEKKTGNNSFLLKKFAYYLLMIIGSSALIMTCLIVYSINKNKSDLRNFEATQTQGSIIEATQTQGSIIATTQTSTQLSAMNKIVDGYLTAIENENWQVAYTYLCAEIQHKIPSPLNMKRRIFAESSSMVTANHPLPDSHTILSPSDSDLPYRVRFTIAGPNWWSGTYEAKLEKNSLKICGVGLLQGDLRYLLSPGTTPLDITP